MNAPLQKQVKPKAPQTLSMGGGRLQGDQSYSSSREAQQTIDLQRKAGNYAVQSRTDATSPTVSSGGRGGPRSSEEVVELNATIGGVYIAAARIDIADGLLKAYSRNIASRLASVEAFSSFQRQLQEEFPVTSWLVTRFTSDLPESREAPANLARADNAIRRAEYRAAVDLLAMAENEVDQLVKATSGYQESQEIATSRFISGLQGAKVAGGIAVGVLTAGSGTAAVAAVGAGYTAVQEASEQAMKVHLGLMREIDWEGIVVDAIINLAIGKLLAGLNRFSRGKEFAQPFGKVTPWELRKIPEQEIKQFAIATGKYLLSKQTVKEILHAKLAAFLQITVKTGYDSLRNRDKGQGFSESIKQKFSGMLFDEKGEVDFQGIFFQALSDALGSATNRAAATPTASASTKSEGRNRTSNEDKKVGSVSDAKDEVPNFDKTHLLSPEQQKLLESAPFVTDYDATKSLTEQLNEWQVSRPPVPDQPFAKATGNEKPVGGLDPYVIDATKSTMGGKGLQQQESHLSNQEQTRKAGGESSSEPLNSGGGADVITMSSEPLSKPANNSMEPAPQLPNEPPAGGFVKPLTPQERQKATDLLRRSVGQAQTGPVGIVRFTTGKKNESVKIIKKDSAGNPIVAEFTGVADRGAQQPDRVTVQSVKGKKDGGRIVSIEVPNYSDLPLKKRTNDDVIVGRAMKASGMLGSRAWSQQDSHVQALEHRGTDMPYNHEPMPRKQNVGQKGVVTHRSLEVAFSNFEKNSPNIKLGKVIFSRELSISNSLLTERIQAFDKQGNLVFDVERDGAKLIRHF